MEINYNSKEILFIPKNINEALLFNEAKTTGRLYERDFEFHPLIVYKNIEDISNLPAIKHFKDWGIHFEKEQRIRDVYRARRKRYLNSMVRIEEVKKTKRYQEAFQLVEDQFGGIFQDGTRLFEYQKEVAALMITKKRLLNALDMGLGKTRTTIVGLCADPGNKRCLIITMSRNINDWVNEFKALGLEDEYIILQKKTDMDSEKRFHIVSYEKWAKSRVMFTFLPNEECPECGHDRFWNMHLGYCSLCKKTQKRLSDEVYSERDLPKKCPYCKYPWKGHYECKHCGFSVIKNRKKALYQYYSNQYDACAIDEGQIIKNGSSKRSQAVRRVNTKSRFVLSGTPAENGTDDLFWILAWLTGCDHRFDDPIAAELGNPRPFQGYGKVGEEHFRQFFSGGKRKALLDIDDVRPRVSNEVKLWDLLDTLMIRKKKTDEEVEKEINVPEPRHHRMHLTLYEAERELYDDILSQFRDWYALENSRKEAAKSRGETYRISTIEICQWLDKLRKAASSPWQFPQYDVSKGITTTKLEFLKNKAKDLLRRNKKILVFSGHKTTVEELGVLLEGVVPGKEAGYIHGGVKMSNRWEMMNRFQDPKDPLSILVMSHRTGAESYTLTQAKAVFLYDLDFNAKKIEQCYSRAVRTGQQDIVDIYWMIGLDTIDANMHGLVLSKQSGVDLAIDRTELDMDKIAKQFKGDMNNVGSSASTIDYVKFASEMLGRGTLRADVTKGEVI